MRAILANPGGAPEFETPGEEALSRPSPETPLLSIKDLSIKYGNKHAVKDFNLEIGKGEVVSFVGESGSGKTTVARAVMGLLPPAAKIGGNSSVKFLGRELFGLPPKKWARIRGDKISMIFQDSGNMLNPVRSIGSQFKEYILTKRSVSGKSALNLAAENLFRTGLSDPLAILKSYPFQLSGGMRQRVGIAMAMVFKPDLLIADEPTSALDATTQKQVIEELRNLKSRENMAIILVTHNLGVASFISDRIVVLRNGDTMDEGDPDTLIDAPGSDYTRELLAAVPALAD
ncbi:MAG: ABC transporter ATP-binding protein [Deltaproteobacteria bacterium]|jgi:peptide/nickel transport system ATP-binding protein|nr:ABC transporter ATP-binding protein [Deltaproteobacteria bacterium]